MPIAEPFDSGRPASDPKPVHSEAAELIRTRRALHRLTTAVWNAVLSGQINARSEAGDAALDAHDMLQQLPAEEREALEAFTELCRRDKDRQRPLEEFQAGR